MDVSRELGVRLPRDVRQQLADFVRFFRVFNPILRRAKAESQNSQVVASGDEGHADPATRLRPIVQGGGEHLRVLPPFLGGGRLPDPWKRRWSGLQGWNDVLPRFLDDQHLPLRQSEVITGESIYLVQHLIQYIRRLHWAVQLLGCAVDQSNQSFGGAE